MKRGRRGETRKLNDKGLVLHLKIQEEEGELGEEEGQTKRHKQEQEIAGQVKWLSLCRCKDLICRVHSQAYWCWSNAVHLKHWPGRWRTNAASQGCDCLEQEDETKRCWNIYSHSCAMHSLQLSSIRCLRLPELLLSSLLTTQHIISDVYSTPTLHSFSSSLFVLRGGEIHVWWRYQTGGALI